MTKIVPLASEQHAGLKLKPTTDFSYMKDQHILPLAAQEFIAVSADVPVVFVKNDQSEQLMPVAMLGLKPGDNLMVGEDGQWLAQYIPGIVTTYPLRLMPSAQGGNQMVLGIDEESDLLSKDEGESLFNEDGSESEYLTKRIEALKSYFEHSQITAGFAAMLKDLDLFAERTLSVDVNGDQVNLTGLHFIDEQKLNALPDDKFADLRKRGFLPAIYAHMISINQIRNLGKKKADRDGGGA